MSNEVNDEQLKALKSLEIPAPAQAARQRALAAAMAAFEAEKAAPVENSALQPKASGWAGRLKSIFTLRIGDWTMDTRIAVGTAAVALLLLPIGWQLYTSTALTPAAIRGTPPVEQQMTTAQTPDVTVTAPTEPAAAKVEAAPVAPEPVAGTSQMLDTETADSDALSGQVAPQGGEAVATRTVAPPPVGAAAPMTMSESAADMAPSDMMLARPAPLPMVGASPESYAPAQTQVSGDEFTRFDESPVKVAAEEPVSTFSIDVDTASYSYVRSQLTDGYIPSPDAVRVEELINYFPYDYPAATTTDAPFASTMAIYPSPWNPGAQLLHIGIKGFEPAATDLPPSNLVFLLDTSGSMDEPNKLPLLKRAFSLLVDQLDAGDTVSIVAYAGSAGVVLEPTKASDRQKILSALDSLYAGGSTAGAEGIELAYSLAEQNFIAGGNNRVILATDGDFNVGISDPEDLLDYVERKRDSGVFLSVLGFGLGNYQDDTMQALAQNGNGNAAYIDTFKEAQKVLVEEMGGTLLTIAKDVKIQVEFNPAVVAEYRLIGYETRALNREDFNNDKVDAGEIGAGHTVTAIYEIVPVGSDATLVDPLRYGQPETPVATPATADASADEYGFLKIRYKAPDSDTSRLIETPITRSLVLDDIAEASDDMRFAAAVAAFGQKLKGSDYVQMDWPAIRALAQGARGADESGYRAEFIQLIGLAQSLVK